MHMPVMKRHKITTGEDGSNNRIARLAPAATTAGPSRRLLLRGGGGVGGGDGVAW